MQLVSLYPLLLIQLVSTGRRLQTCPQALSLVRLVVELAVVLLRISVLTAKDLATFAFDRQLHEAQLFLALAAAAALWLLLWHLFTTLRVASVCQILMVQL